MEYLDTSLGRSELRLKLGNVGGGKEVQIDEKTDFGGWCGDRFATFFLILSSVSSRVLLYEVLYSE